jgi:hypothetical protein
LDGDFLANRVRELFCDTRILGRLPSRGFSGDANLSLFNQAIYDCPDKIAVLRAYSTRESGCSPFRLFLKSPFDAGSCRSSCDLGAGTDFGWLNLPARAGRWLAFLLLVEHLFNQLKCLQLAFVVGGKFFLELGYFRSGHTRESFAGTFHFDFRSYSHGHETLYKRLRLFAVS